MAIPAAVLSPTNRANRFADEFPTELPHFTDESMARFPYLSSWQSRMDQWYYEFRTVLRRSLSDLDLAIDLSDVKESSDAGLADLGGQITGSQSDISDLLARVSALEAQLVALHTTDANLQSEIDAILPTLASLRSQLADHETRISQLENVVFNPDVIQGTADEIDVVYTPGFITIGIVDPLIIGKGGTGAATAVAAFNNLSPTSARGDIIIRDASNNVRLPVGAVKTYIRSDGTDPSWQLIASTDITNTTFVTSVSGTAGRISSSGGLTPVIDMVATAVTPAAYGDASHVGQFTVDGYGRLTAAASVAIAIDASAITSGTLGVTRGGTGAATLTGVIQGTGTAALTGITGTANYFPKWNTSAQYLTATSNLLDDGTNIIANSGAAYAWGSSGINTPDTFLVRGGIRQIHMRSGTNPNVFYVMNSYTNGSTYEGLYMGWSSNVCYVYTETPASTARELRIGTYGAAGLSFMVNGTVCWQVQGATGHLVLGLDITYNIGAAAQRVKDFYLGGNFYLSGVTAGYLKGNTTSPVSSVASIPFSDVTGTIPINQGGTGQITATLAFNALSPITTRGDLITRDATNNIRLGIGTVGKYLRTDGTDPSWSALLTTDLSGTITIAQGGTGQTTAILAFNALSPITTRGDLITRDATNNIRLGIGSAAKYLRSDGTDPSWQTIDAGDLTTTLAGIIEGVGSGALTAITGTASYLPKWSATAPYLTTSVLYDTGSRIGLGTTTPLDLIHLLGDGVNAGLRMTGYGSNASVDVRMNWARANGTLALPTIVSNNDNLFRFIASGYDGSAFQPGTEIRGTVDGTPSAGAGHIPGRMTFYTGDGAGVVGERMRIDSSGNVGIGATSFGTSMTKGLAMLSGTAPSGNVTDCFQMYSSDQAAGNASPTFRTENGAVIRLSQDTGWTLPTGTASKAGFATSTATLTQVAQTVKAMMDHLMTTVGLFAT